MTLHDLVPWTRERFAPSRSPAREDNPFLALHREINRLFDDTLRGFGAPEAARFVPRLDLVENDEEIRVVLEVPGLEQKDVEVTLTGDVLVVRGQKRDRREGADKKERWHLVESRWGAFERAIQLPCEVEGERVKARAEHGVLTVTLPKAASAKPQVRRIEIQS